MTIQARLQSLPLPVSAIALLAAIVLGSLDYQAAGWLLFGIGVITWARFDSRHLLKADRNGLSPALALLAYTAVAADQANAAVTFALALHALVVFLILISRHLSEEGAQAISQQKGISQRI
ncbi:hypothetical protein GJ698_17765 [Pseudoduganella sp. FT26W]|uniref:Uncharacterized protein n=1 Tax=Duganella aquatilis TaxID=2666082 RepID=A0A844CZK3_9BURK|nr:hypothetical protein [Duganella aquatilis]MRW85923.1 hypothetical protein [Duganella aquatilis]